MPLFGEWDHKHEELPNTHPRRAGTRAKSLRLAREHDLDMVKMIAALSTNAAVHLGNTGLKAMQERGRIQKGMIADLTLFDPGTVTDNANYANGLPTSTGVEYVLVSGQIALERGEVVEATRAGKALRFESNNR
jgi:N-acyl-D-glutamate deacylase